MGKFLRLPLLLAAVSMPAAAVTVESATGDWSKLPQLSQRGYQNLTEKTQAKLFEVAESKQCPSFVLTQGRLDFRISFATQYASDGSLERLIIPKLDCAEAEGVVGGAVLGMLQAGDYGPTGKSKNGWYQGELGFTFAGDSARTPAVAQTSNPQTHQLVSNGPDPNETVCHKIHEIGSRIDVKRICMTRSQWAEEERVTKQQVNQAQSQRGCRNTC